MKKKMDEVHFESNSKRKEILFERIAAKCLIKNISKTKQNKVIIKHIYVFYYDFDT